MDKLVIEPIAYIKSDLKEKFGTPRQSGKVDSLISKITFTKEHSKPNAFRGIEGFSHLWLIFGFSLVKEEGWSETVRPPRLGGNKKMGVFATRSPFRPNKLGLSSVKLIKAEQVNGITVLTVSGADLVDGTPIYDVKPYLPFTDCHLDATEGFAGDFTDYSIEVNFPSELLNIIPDDKKNALIDCLKEDPRPSYQNDDNRIYGMKFDKFNVKFSVSNGVLTVLDVESF